jgi:hypothetical protein
MLTKLQLASQGKQQIGGEYGWKVKIRSCLRNKEAFNSKAVEFTWEEWEMFNFARYLIMSKRLLSTSTASTLLLPPCHPP